MTDLLEKVLDVHGGLENWRGVSTIDFRLLFRGAALAAKQQPQGLRDVSVKVDTRRNRTWVTPFPAPGRRGKFEAGAISIETDTGDTVLAVDDPRGSFGGHGPQSAWTEAQFLYFVGYALHNYMTMPFLLVENGVQCEEIASHEEHGEQWRVLRVTFPSDIHVHCSEQLFYFNEAGHLVRNDYAPDVTRGTAAHYTFDHQVFDGFVFPTHRRVVRRDEAGRTFLTGPSIFRLDIGSVTLS